MNCPKCHNPIDPTLNNYLRQALFGIKLYSICDDKKCRGMALVQMPEPTRLNSGLYWEKICLDCDNYQTKQKPRSQWVTNEFAEKVVDMYIKTSADGDIVKEKLKVLTNE